jgi:serine/threonine protein kinase
VKKVNVYEYSIGSYSDQKKKILMKQYYPAAEAAARQEVAMLRQLIRVPGVAKLHDYGRYEEKFFLSYTLCDFRDVEGYLNGMLPSDKEEAIESVARETAKVMKDLADSSIIFRNLTLLSVQVVLNSANHSFQGVRLLGFEDAIRGPTSTLEYPRLTHIAPEIQTKQSYDYRSDIWSFGTFLYRLLAPFGVPQAKLFHANQGVPPSSGSNKIKDVIMRCLVIDPAKRITWQEAIDTFSTPVPNS